MGEAVSAPRTRRAYEVVGVRGVLELDANGKPVVLCACASLREIHIPLPEPPAVVPGRSAEKSRRARSCDPPQPACDVLDGDEWYAGFASALAQIWRLSHDGQLVRHIMAATGIGPKHFESASVSDYDMAAILAARALPVAPKEKP